MVEKGTRGRSARSGGAKGKAPKKTARKPRAGFAALLSDQDGMLQQMDHLFRVMLENTHVVIFATDASGLLTFVTPSFEQVAGYTPAEAMGRHFSEFIHPEDLPRVQQQFEKLSRGILEPNEYRLAARSGAARWVLSSSRPLHDRSGKFAGIMGMLTDVQRSRTAEEAFQETEERFRATFDLAAVGIAHLAPDWTWLRANATLYDMIGYSRDELAAMAFVDITHPEDRAADLAGLRQLDMGRVQAATREKRIVRKDGFTVAANCTVSAVRDPAGAVKYFIAVVEDITGRKRVEDTLQLLRTAVESIPLGITIANMDGRIVYVNPAEARMHGYAVDELLGKEARLFAPSRQWSGQTLRELLARNLISDTPFSREAFNVRKDGTAFPAVIRSVPVRDMRGAPLALVSVSEDITERKQMIDSLKESEFRHRTLFENANDAIFITDTATGIVTDCNVRACDLLGMPRDEIIGRDHARLHPPEDAGRYEEQFASLTPEHRSAMFNDSIVLRKDGKRVWVDISSNLFESNGRGFVMSLYRDVSHRKLAEEQFVSWVGQLRESEKRFRELADLLPQPVFETDERGAMSFANKTAFEHFGFSQADMAAGMPVLHLLAAADRGRAGEDLKRALAGEQLGGGEYHAVRKDGREFPVIISVSPIVRDGRTAGLRGIVMDITERMNIETAIAQAKWDWESTFDTITDMITIHDENFNIIRSNKAAADILGLTWLEMGRAKCYEYYHGTEGPPAGCPSCESLRTGQPSVQERYEPHLDRHFEIRAIPRLDEAGGVRGLIHVVRDITRRKQAEEEHAMLEARLRDAEKLEVIGSLAGGVAHEVRNPLNAIMALTDALDREVGGNPEYRTFMHHMRTQVERLSSLMNELLELGKPVDRSRLRREPLGEICSLSIDAWKLSKWGWGRDVELAGPPGGGDLFLRADGKKLQQVFINLLDNAAQHSPEGAGLRMEIVQGNGNTAQVRVIDRGSGIPEEVLSKVFDTFFTTRRGGTGLGLSIVKHIVEMHGGAVALENNAPPPGSTATVILPTEESAQP